MSRVRVGWRRVRGSRLQLLPVMVLRTSAVTEQSFPQSSFEVGVSIQSRSTNSHTDKYLGHLLTGKKILNVQTVDPVKCHKNG